MHIRWFYFWYQRLGLTLLNSGFALVAEGILIYSSNLAL